MYVRLTHFLAQRPCTLCMFVSSASWSLSWQIPIPVDNVNMGQWEKISQSELQKGKTFTPAAFWGPKNLHQKCVIRDKFNATKSAWFATNSILKRLKNIIYIQNCKKNTEIIFKVQNICNICFLGPKNLHQNCVIRDKVIFYTTRYRVLHQNFYTSWEILHQQRWYRWYVFASLILIHPNPNLSWSY